MENWIGNFMYVGFQLIIYGFIIYCLVLFIKLAKRGIQALDIFISQNKKE